MCRRSEAHLDALGSWKAGMMGTRKADQHFVFYCFDGIFRQRDYQKKICPQRDGTTRIMKTHI
jgi:hypothetical protein